jgi:hypothetical protein
MWLAVRRNKSEVVKSQIAQLLGVSEGLIASDVSCYTGIALLELDDSKASTGRSIRNIECLHIEESIAKALLKPSLQEQTFFLKSLETVAAREQYEHLSSLLYINKLEKKPT